jgi:hypothetical protein
VLVCDLVELILLYLYMMVDPSTKATKLLGIPQHGNHLQLNPSDLLDEGGQNL